VVNAGVNTQYTYNGDGDRLAQIVAGVTTKYALDPTGLAQVLIETTSGQSTHYLPGLAQYGGNAWAYYLQDRLGNLRQLTNNTGQVALSQSFDPFGNLLEQTGSGQSIFGYTGEQTDPTGLVFLRARYYSPYLNRFISPDTIIPNPTQSQSWNRYLYVGNNPINYTDPYT
jgi:RHS repeat-associated protein